MLAVKGARMDLTGHDRLARAVLAMRDGIDDIEVTELSQDGLVTVVVTGRGKLAELELDPRIYRDQNAAALAETIMSTVRAAMDTAEHDAARLVADLMPGTREVDTMFDPALAVLAREHRR
jgi:DNA-binding protein YbaB